MAVFMPVTVVLLSVLCGERGGVGEWGRPKFLFFRNRSGASKESSQSLLIPHNLTQAAGLQLDFLKQI